MAYDRPTFQEHERVDMAVDAFTAEMTSMADKVVALRQQREFEAVENAINFQAAQVQQYFIENEGQFNMLGRVSEFEDVASQQLMPMIDALPDGVEKAKILTDLKAKKDTFKAQAMRLDFESEVGFAIGRGQDGYKKAFAQAISEGEEGLAYGTAQDLMDYNEKLAAHGIISEAEVKALEVELKQGVSDAAINRVLSDSLVAEANAGPAAALKFMAKALEGDEKEDIEGILENAGKNLSAAARDKISRRYISLKNKVEKSYSKLRGKLKNDFIFQREVFNETKVKSDRKMDKYHSGHITYEEYDESLEILETEAKDLVKKSTALQGHDKAKERRRAKEKLDDVRTERALAWMYKEDPVSFYKNPDFKAVMKRYPNVSEEKLKSLHQDMAKEKGGFYDKDTNEIKYNDKYKDYVRFIDTNADSRHPLKSKMDEVDDFLGNLGEKTGKDFSATAEVSKRALVAEELTNGEAEPKFSKQDKKKVQSETLGLLEENKLEELQDLIGFAKQHKLQDLFEGSGNLNPFNRDSAFIIGKAIKGPPQVSEYLSRAEQIKRTPEGKRFYDRTTQLLERQLRGGKNNDYTDDLQELMQGLGASSPDEAVAYIATMVTGYIGDAKNRSDWLKDANTLYEKIEGNKGLINGVFAQDVPFGKTITLPPDGDEEKTLGGIIIGQSLDPKGRKLFSPFEIVREKVMDAVEGVLGGVAQKVLTYEYKKEKGILRDEDKAEPLFKKGAGLRLHSRAIVSVFSQLLKEYLYDQGKYLPFDKDTFKDHIHIGSNGKVFFRDSNGDMFPIVFQEADDTKIDLSINMKKLGKKLREKGYSGSKFKRMITGTDEGEVGLTPDEVLDTIDFPESWWRERLDKSVRKGMDEADDFFGFGLW